MQRLRDLHQDRGWDETLRRRVGVLRPSGAWDVDGPPDCEREPARSEARAPRRRPQLNFRPRADETKSPWKKAGKRFYALPRHGPPALADEVTVAVILVLVAIGAATFLETRFLRRKMKNRRGRTAERDEEGQDETHQALRATETLINNPQT